MAFNKKTHLRQNIDALKTAFTLDRERRAPTPEEERTLGAYSGFGAIKEVLENPTGKPDKDGMATLVAELHEVIRANTPDEREYKRYMDGIKNSVLTAFYTPPKVADAIVEAIWDTRIVPKRILDPSAGTGVFVSAVDFHAPYAEITCFEKDPATGLILKHLHPKTGAGTGIRAHRTQIRRLLRRGREQHPFRGRGALRPVLLHPYRPRAAARHTGAAQLFFHEVRRYGTRGRPGGIHHLAGSIERRAGTPRARVADEPLRARIGHPAAEQPLYRTRGDGGRQRPGYPAKESRHGELSERQRDFIESRKLSNGIRINNLFQSFDRVIHTEAKVGKDPYGKPAMEFTHAEGVDGIDREMRRMLSEDFNRHFNESYCLEHAPEQTPGTPERELSRPRQAERQRAERHEPRLAGEIVKEIIADARNLQQQREEEEKRRVVAEMAAQGYHVDTETGEITRIENKPGQVLPDSAATPAGEPTGEDLADFGAWSKERENRLWEQHPPKPEDFGMADTPVQHVGGTTEPKPQEGFAGSLFDTVETAAAEPVNVQQEPLLTLYDLFGFSAEERRQAELGISKKRNSRRGAKRKTPRQPSLFAPASSPEEQKSEMPKATPPERDPEDLYASLNWEDNPPINGFYEMMMSLTPERRAELRRQSARQQETPEQRERQAVRPPTEAPKDRRKQAAGTPRTGGLFDTPDNPEEEEPGKEMPQIREADMKPRPFEGEVAPYFREGTLVTDGQNRVGYLRED